MKRSILCITAILIVLLLGCSVAFAADDRAEIKASGFGKASSVGDGSRGSYTQAQAGNSVILTAPDGKGIEGVYVEFDRPISGTWTIKDSASGKTAECGKDSFLHEFADTRALFGSAPAKLELSFTEGSWICDVYGFCGDIPDWVQRWEAPLEEADLLLLSTHSDDEQLFFAGILPYYAIERKLDVQVVYFIQHFRNGNTIDHTRPHEQLDGLWTVGIRNYPYISEFPDLYAESKNREDVLKKIQAAFKPHGYEYDDFLDFTVGVLRRFKPLVVVSHDLDGEYGHGAHVLNADVLCKAVETSGDGSSFPESAAKYGTWTPEKLYLHLYPENPIVMDWDTPYDSMGGKTPFQMTQDGFACHKSQHWTWFYKWIYGTSGSPITKASQIKNYSPCNYGLYFSTVGKDGKGGDFFENVQSYEERRAEAERIAAEEAARKAAEEEAARLKAEEEQRRLEEEIRLAEEADRKARSRRLMMLGAAAAIVVAGAAFWFFKQGKKGKH